MTTYELEVNDPDGGGAILVNLAGELDLTNAGEIERRLVDVSSRGSGLVLDLNRVTFVDSAALHMLFRVARQLGPDGQFGILLEPTALVARALEIVGFGDVAHVGSTLDELVADRTS